MFLKEKAWYPESSCLYLRISIKSFLLDFKDILIDANDILKRSRLIEDSCLSFSEI
jgi:hypothetical protein